MTIAGARTRSTPPASVRGRRSCSSRASPSWTGDMRVTGYRVAVRDRGWLVSHGERSAARLLGDVLSGVGLDELVGELARPPAASRRRFCWALGVPPVRPDRVLLRIAHDTALRPGGRTHARRAHRTRVRAVALRAPGPRLRRLAARPVRDRRGRASRLVARPTRRAPWRVIRAAGDAAGRRAWSTTTQFERGQGARVRAVLRAVLRQSARAAVRKIPVGEMGTLVALAALQGGSATIEELEQVIDRDVGLSVKLLRYINSAYVGMRGSITSIRQAVMMLGSRGVSRWALLVALTGGPQHASRAVGGRADARADVRAARLRAPRRGRRGAVHGRAAVGRRRAARRPARDDRRGTAAGRSGVALRCCAATGPRARSSTPWSATSGATSTSPHSRSHSRGIASSYRDALGWAVETVSALN